MLPNGVSKLFASLRGEDALLLEARENLNSTIQSIEKTGIGVYVACNGKTASGDASLSPERYYWWSKTEIDGAYVPELVKSNDSDGLQNEIENSPEFRHFKEKVDALSEGKLQAQAYVRIIPPHDDAKTAAIVRTGFTVQAKDSRSFTEGAESLRAQEETMLRRPLHINLPDAEHAFKWSFREP